MGILDNFEAYLDIELKDMDMKEDIDKEDL